MKRKILRVGRSSYAVSLPMDFIEMNNIQTSEEIDVEHHGATILIRCEAPRSAFKEVDISELVFNESEEKMMDKILGVLFRQGLDHFTLKCGDKKKAGIIKEILRKGKLSMYEEPEKESDDCVTIHCSITHFDENALENMSNVIIKQLYQNFEEFVDIMATIRGTQQKTALDGIALRDKIIGEECDICRRIINKNVINYRSTASYNFVDKLEKIGDSVRDLAVFAHDNPKAIIKYLPLIEEMKGFFYMLYQANTNFSMKKINLFYQRYFEFEKKIEMCDDKVIYYCLKNSMTITKAAYSNLMILNL